MPRRRPKPIINRNMRLFRSTINNTPDMRDLIKNAELSVDELIFEILNETKKDVIRFLKGYTNKTVKGDYRAQFGLLSGMKAPDRNKVEWKDFAKWWDIRRPMHPGGWGDLTMDLVNSYTGEVTKNGIADYTFTIDNTSDHAKYVEAMNGLFVTAGVMDPGGIVDKAIRRSFGYLTKVVSTGPRGGRRVRQAVNVDNLNGAINATEIP